MAYRDLEKKRRTRAAYYERHRDEYGAQWRANSAAYREKHREEIRAKNNSPEGKAQRAAYFARPEVRIRQQKFKRVRRYGLAHKDFVALVELQAGLCAMCCEPMNPKGGTQIDHNHKTGAVRGLLCITCNFALGILENVELVERARVYLKVFDPWAPAL